MSHPEDVMRNTHETDIRIPPAERIADAIDNMISIKNRLSDIHAKINGAPSQPSDLKKEATNIPPALRTVLEEAPNELDDIRSSCHEILDQIESVLF